ncbi:FAD-binding protein [Vicingaceae bacterium]|nr:FAD-binding protein [Vicingaceae bacterium]
MSQTNLGQFLDTATDLIKSSARIRIVGGQSKQRLHTNSDDFVQIKTMANCGVVEYDPNEFTITVLSGTTIRELNSILSENNQFLPFDPMFENRGATIGGTIASGLNGSCRLLAGGMRDFVLGAQFIDGDGNLIRAGGKVVKNAAGFDLPKFFVGSAGRGGLLVELTLKVFPRPASTLTLRADSNGLTVDQIVDAIFEINSMPLELSGLDWVPDGPLLVRLAGIHRAIELQAAEIARRTGLGFETLSSTQEAMIWEDSTAANWMNEEIFLAKIPTTVRELTSMEQSLGGNFANRRYCAAGNVCLVSLPGQQELTRLDEMLKQQQLAAQVVVGDAKWNLIGTPRDMTFLDRVNQAMDPERRFGSFA